jgi:AcrR family transcriptional regulator
MQNALLDLLASKSYSKISVSEITAAADVARTTFYTHFNGKDELLMSCLDDIFDSFFENFQAKFPASQTPNLDHEISLLLLQEWRKNKDTLDRIRLANVDYLIFQRIKENQKNAFRSEARELLGTSSNPVVEDYIISFVAGTVFAVLMQWTDRGMKDPPEAIAKLLHLLVQRKSLPTIRANFDAELGRNH